MQRDHGLGFPLRLHPENQSIDFTLSIIEAMATVPGDIVECGVWHGQGVITMAAYLDHIGSHKHVWGFDSFEGLPAPDEIDGRHPRAAEGTFGDTSLPAVEQLIAICGYTSNITLVEGLFSETCPKADVDPISVLVVDCDLYQSYLDVFGSLYPRVSPGGVVILDEYGRPEKYPGARAATDEFFADMPEGPEFAWWHPHQAPRWYVRKPI